MRHILICLLFITYNTNSFAQVPIPAPGPPPDSLEDEQSRENYRDSFGHDDGSEDVVVPPVKSVNSQTVRMMSDVGIFYTYTPFAFLVPGRHGLELDWIVDEDWTISAEYAKASYSASLYSVDLASFSERIYGLHARYYPGNSFNLQFGLGRREHELRIGEDIIPSGSRSVSVSSSLIHFALGNRWQWANGFSLGADWLVIDIPVGPAQVDDDDIAEYVADKNDRKNIREFLSAMRYLPSFGALRIAIGYVF